jgi:hypothetical protein
MGSRSFKSNLCLFVCLSILSRFSLHSGL